MKALFEAIDSRFQASAGTGLHLLLDGQLFQGEAPQGTRVPYGVFHLIVDDADYNFSSSFAICRLQFDYYHNRVEAADELYEAHKALFDDAPLEVAGFELIRFQRMTGRKFKEGHAWRWVVEHLAELEKE